MTGGGRGVGRAIAERLLSQDAHIGIIERDEASLDWVADHPAGNSGDPQRITREMARLHPLGRVGQAGEVAAAVAYLLSDEASFISGACCPSTVDVRFKARTPKSARHRLASRPRRRTLDM